MAYRCRICDSNEVEHPGDICELCKISQQDPYVVSMGGASFSTEPKIIPEPSDNTYAPKRSKNRKVLLNGGASPVNQNPYGNDIRTSQEDEPVRVYDTGKTPQPASSNTQPAGMTVPARTTKKQPVVTGITKNITVDSQRKSPIEKWFRTLFQGTPFTLDDEITMFQVFPDYTGTSRNALGNACDQVIVYGHLRTGAVSENNSIEVYGRRDSDNYVIANVIRNVASGTTIVPQKSIGAGVVRAITAAAIFLIFAIVVMLSPEEIIGAAILIICLTHLSTVFRIVRTVLGKVFSFLKRSLKKLF